jgi:hypothetical protein
MQGIEDLAEAVLVAHLYEKAEENNPTQYS